MKMTITIHAKRALFIKLGEGGEWDDYCLRDNQVLRIGYREIDHDACMSGKEWDGAVLEQCRNIVRGRSIAAARNHVRQLQEFYEASPEDTIWITFFGGCLWWCKADDGKKILDDKTKTRSVRGAWSNKDIRGIPLTFSTLNGRLLATKAYRGTICEVREKDYLLDKINGRTRPEVTAAQNTMELLAKNLVPLIKKLNEDDFEILIDLIFRQGGFYRTGKLGGNQKDIDLDLINPISNQKIAVQVKSTADENMFIEYKKIFKNMPGGKLKFIFATHSPSGDWAISEALVEGNIELWLVDKIAEHAVRMGLAGWLIDKAI